MNQNQFSQIPYIWWQLVRAYNINGNTVNINHAEIALLSILNNLGKGVNDGGGYACNETLAKYINVSERTITRYLAELEAVGFIKSFHSREKGSHITTLRKVYVQHKFISDLIDEMMADEKPIQDDGSSSQNCLVLNEAVDNFGTSTSQLGYKHSPTLVEGVANLGRSSSQNCLPNITIIQQEYNNSITNNTSSPELSSACSLEEKAVEDNIPNEALSVASAYMTRTESEMFSFRKILVDECRSRNVDIGKVSRHWLGMFCNVDAPVDIKPKGSTSTDLFKTYCGMVINHYEGRNNQ